MTSGTVLIVDDNAANRTAFEALVQPLGLRTLLADSGAGALQCLEREAEVAVILMDVRMPGLDGFQAADRIRSLSRHAATPIIFLTAAQPGAAQRTEAYAHGAVDYLIKPIDPTALVSKVRFFADAWAQRRGLEQEAEAQRVRADAQTQLAQEFREQLAAIVTHDLRNPLGAVQAGVQLLLEFPADETQRQILRRVLSANQRAHRLVNNVLELTRLSSGNALRLRPATSDIHQIVQDIVGEFCMSHDKDCIHVRQHGDGLGHWDEVRIGEVIANLISNALQHGQAREPVVVETAGEPQEVVLSVSNRGRAIPEELLATLFHPPVRKPSERPRKHGSTGLGLFIVDQIVRAHGGSIQVRSHDVEGTAFLVRLPRRAVC